MVLLLCRALDCNSATTDDSDWFANRTGALGRSQTAALPSSDADITLSIRHHPHLIDSGFTFANRRLAEHYGINEQAGEPITGLQMRKITLPADSERGGILTQESVLKVTANGTVTSPVVRGNYVLTNILGTPVSPPPPNVGSIEPDTRGTTTIRETLDAHRNIEACALCHRRIDPPGFALETFDPIGGLRDHYRATAEKMRQWGPTPYSTGPDVNASGVTEDGDVIRDQGVHFAICHLRCGWNRRHNRCAAASSGA